MLYVLFHFTPHVYHLFTTFLGFATCLPRKNRPPDPGSMCPHLS